jgi:hypothetical protein
MSEDFIKENGHIGSSWGCAVLQTKEAFRVMDLLKDGSVLKLGDEQLPLTCIHVSGQDNRFSGKKTPLIPDLIFKIIFVANDFSCSGPITPGWPESGGRKEAWSTYLFYVVKDPTIMLPVDAKIRYRWNEFEAVLAGP